MLRMVSDGRAEDKYIIKIDDDEPSNECSQCLVHNAHESTWSIRKTKRHHQPFKKAFTGFKSRLPFVPGSNTYLVITTFKVDFGKKFGRTNLIQKIIQARNRKPITNCNCVDCAAVHTHTPPSIFGIKRAGTEQGLRLSLMWPFRKRSSTCLRNSSCSSGLMR